ncbi:MAG: substrate-binding domain-containing protein, partial [Clostridiales bacterium]|nr:substrate-binding domain-containing protein [Clostridiales bacterium]
ELDSPLRVCTIESLCFSKLPPILSYFRSHYPKVAIQIITDSPEELIRQMERNELDLIYILDVPRYDKDWVKAMEIKEDMVFVASPHSHLIKKQEKPTSIEDLTEETFFLTEKNANYRQAFDQCLAERKLSISPLMEISNTEFIILMLEQNEGISLLPYFAVQQYVNQERLVILDIQDIHITMYRQLFYHKSKFESREMKEFIRLATEEFF